ncbi:hypothetical protein [Nocardia carnea]|uniref:hypothetical protein n=1 Tax=Nocardia carnea TaxID=37328 RepID=UPI002453F0F5|nr:hypothetical protein [Nocardia carnea]
MTDQAEAAADVPLAALSAITHVNDPCIGAILKALAGALQSIDESDAEVFALLTEAGLGTTPAGDTWRHPRHRNTRECPDPSSSAERMRCGVQPVGDQPDSLNEVVAVDRSSGVDEDGG